MHLSERLGHALGTAIAPLVGLAARARHARMFHPTGVTYVGQLTGASGPYEDVMKRLGSVVLARFSPALSKTGREHFEVLGVALRFRHGALSGSDAHADDQDLLFATISRPIYLGLSPFLTNAHDYLANTFYATSPFQPDGVDHRVYLRLVPLANVTSDAPRAQRLREAVDTGLCAFSLEARQLWTRTWHRIGTVSLDAPIELDQAALRFDPFLDGAGIRPVGFIHSIRHGAYAASQHNRPPHRS